MCPVQTDSPYHLSHLANHTPKDLIISHATWPTESESNYVEDQQFW